MHWGCHYATSLDIEVDPQRRRFTFYVLRFVYFAVTWASANPREAYMKVRAPASEVLAKVSLAHSYPGFCRTGDLRCRSCFGPRMFSGDVTSLSKLLSELSSGFSPSRSYNPTYNAGRAGLGWMNGWFN